MNIFPTGTEQQSAEEYAELRQSIKSLIARVHLHRTVDADSVAKTFDVEFASALCNLKVELESLRSDFSRMPDRPGFRSVSGSVLIDIDDILTSDQCFGDLAEFEAHLYALLSFLEQLKPVSGSRTKWLRYAPLLPLAPAIGLILYWGLVNYYSVALLEAVDVMSPDTPFELTDADWFSLTADGYYRAKYDNIQSELNKFEDHYFRETRGAPETDEAESEDPLPTVFDDVVAKKWGISGLPEDQKKNLFVCRVFLRNIKDPHTVNKVGIAIRRDRDSPFFWDRFDLSTELEITSRQRAFEVRTTRTPVKDVVASLRPITILNRPCTPTVEDKDHIVTSETFTPSFGEHKEFDNSFPIILKFQAVDMANLADVLPNAFQVPEIRNLDQLDNAMASIRAHAKDNPLTYLPCLASNDAIVIANDMSALKKIIGVTEINELTLDVRYSWLSDERLTKTKKVTFPQNFVFIDETNRADESAIYGCIAPHIQVPHEPVTNVRNVPSHTLDGPMIARAIYTLAGKLSDDVKAQGGEIVIEETFYCDMKGSTDLHSQFHRDVNVLKNGDFVVINVILTNYPSGIYELELYLNDDVAQSVKIDPLWPQSFKYKPADDNLFSSREVDGAEPNIVLP